MGIARRVAVAFTAAATTGTLSLAVVNMASSGAEPEVFCRAGYPGGSGGDGGLSEGGSGGLAFTIGGGLFPGLGTTTGNVNAEGGNGGYARGGNGGRGGSGTLPICNQNTNGGWVEADGPAAAPASGGGLSHWSKDPDWDWWDDGVDRTPRRNSWVFEDYG